MALRPVRKTMTEYPNYNWLQVEEINQTILNYCPDDLKEESCVDVTEIAKKYPHLCDEDGYIVKSFKNIRYNFVLVSLDITDSIYTWTFEVRIVLWNGKYRIKYPENIEDIEDFLATYDEVEGIWGNKLIIKGKNLKELIVCFELENGGNREILTEEFKQIDLEGTWNLTHQYNLSQTEKVKVVNKQTREAVEGATVKLVPLDSNMKEVGDSKEYLLPYTSSKTGSDGKTSIVYSATPDSGVYYCRLDATYTYPCTSGFHKTHTARDSQIVTVNKVAYYQPQIAQTEWSIYRGEKRTYEYTIDFMTKYGVKGEYKDKKPFVIDIYHTYDSAWTEPLVKPTTSKIITKTTSVTTDENGHFSFTLDSTEFYGSTSTLVFSIKQQGAYDSWTSGDLKVTHEWFYADDWSELQENAPVSTAPNAIVLRQGTHQAPYTSSTSSNPTVYINRKLYLLGEKGKSWATLDGRSSMNCIDINKTPTGTTPADEVKVVIKGIKFINCNIAIKQNIKSQLMIDGCCFVNNLNRAYEGVGVCINQYTKDATIYTYNSYFYNNYGNTHHCKGNSTIDTNLFKIDNWKYPVQPHPYCLEQESNTGKVVNNQFYICPSMYWKDGIKRFHYVNKNKSYSKIAVWVGKNAIVNDKKPSQLKNDGTFNYFGSKWNNRSYTFAAYKQYTGNDRPTLLCSPNSRIHTGCGHASAGWNPRGSTKSRCPGSSTWAYWDGYEIWYLNGRNEAAVKNSGHNLNNPYITIKNKEVIEDARIIVPDSGGVV